MDKGERGAPAPHRESTAMRLIMTTMSLTLPFVPPILVTLPQYPPFTVPPASYNYGLLGLC